MKCPLCLLFLFQSHPAQASLLSLLMSTLAGGRVAYQCCFAFEPAKMPSASRGEEADAAGSLPPTTDEPSQAVAGSDSLDSPPRALERSVGQLPSPPLLPTPPPKAGSQTTKNVTGGSAGIRPSIHQRMLSVWGAATAGGLSHFAFGVWALGRSGEQNGGRRTILSKELWLSGVDPLGSLERMGQSVGRGTRCLLEPHAEGAASPQNEDFVCLSVWVFRCPLLCCSTLPPLPFLPRSVPSSPSVFLSHGLTSPVSSVLQGRTRHKHWPVGRKFERGVRPGGGPKRHRLL